MSLIDGAWNPDLDKLRYYQNKMIDPDGNVIIPSTTQNKFYIGDGSAGDKYVYFNIAGTSGSNPNIRWNNTTSKIEFSYDDSNWYPLESVVAGTGIDKGASPNPTISVDVTDIIDTNQGLKEAANRIQCNFGTIAQTVAEGNHTHTASGVGAIADGADTVKDTHIDWGAGAGQVSAIDVPIADAGGIITGTEVETALQENRTAVNLNTTHRGSNGTDHGYIDQDEQVTASPTHVGMTLSGLSNAGIVKNNVSGVLSDEGKLTDLADVGAVSITYYVDDTLGDDGNDGLAAGAGNAFKTIQKAFDMIMLYRKITGLNSKIQINVADGTYSVAGIVGNLYGVEVTDAYCYAYGIRMIGNLTNPENVIIKNTSNANSVSCLVINVSGYITIQGFQFEISGNGDWTRHIETKKANAQLDVQKCKFNHSGGGESNLDIFIEGAGSTLYAYNNETNINASSYAYYSSRGALIVTSGTRPDGAVIGFVKTNYPDGFSSISNGDIFYANGSVYKRLAKGSDNDLLTLSSGIPAWTASPTFAGATVNGDSSLNGAVTVNESGADKDFRVEGVGHPYALFIQGSDGKVGIKAATPYGDLTIAGNITSPEATSGTVTYKPEIFTSASNLFPITTSYENNDNGWSYGNGALHVISSDHAKYGSKSNKITINTSQVNLWVYYNAGTYLSSEDEDEYVVSTWIYIPSTNGVTQVQLNVRDNGTNFFSGGTPYSSQNITTTDEWVRIIVPFKATTGDTYLCMHGEGIAGNIFYIDGWQLERGNIATEYKSIQENLNHDLLILEGNVGIQTDTPLAKLDVNGDIRFKKDIQTKTGNHAVLSTESNCSFVGKTNAVIFTLPSAVAGLTYSFTVGTDTVRVTVTAAAGDTIDGSAAAGNTWADAIRETITIEAIDSTNWVIMNKLGTWTTT